jgi:excisionase family DNA binding protein
LLQGSCPILLKALAEVSVLTVKEVADRLRVSPSTVYSLVEGGRIPCYRIGTGRGSIRFTEAQVAEFLQACKVEAGSLRSGLRFTHRRK